ncbi:uncharacterized protein LOC129594106 [Paramacrobiotus metropolitanus]|uniref:uncharacterized protein LOC129594106 n=1 Tax=Paramacrobiotus metropolitanus TaxID=2943436 RepID=UPI0024460CA0|nr:uncharacterized protein LOC129594106 [Paramacrobiotus metropolitanus]XP_055346652.1 uncharacterized protein LOC129594106 [Paramacrobiotus metropolitanus]
MPSTRNTASSSKPTTSQSLDDDEDDIFGSETESDTRYELASNLEAAAEDSSDAPVPTTSRYIEQLVACSSRQDGLETLCNLINAKTKAIREQHNMGALPRPSAPISSSLEQLAQMKWGPFGKVGMHIRKETVEELERIIKEDEEAAEQNEAAEAAQEAEDANIQLDEELTAENVEVTLEGLDKDLLGVNSQAALNKLTAFVTRTIEENHPAGKNRVVPPPVVPPKNTTVSTEQPQPLPDNSNTRANPADPFKFAFVSVVATYDAKCRISLEDLHSRVRCCNFDPTWFHNAVITFPRSEVRVAVFENGKMVITGVATIKNALIATRNTLEILRNCGFTPDISKRNFRAKNLTAMMELGVHLDISGFAEKYQDSTYLDQDTFGAVTHLPEKSAGQEGYKGGFGMCFLIFATGRIIMVGGKNEKHMITTFRDKTLGMLKPFAYGWNT